MSDDSIRNLQQLIIDGGQRVFDIAPLAIKNILEGKEWQGRVDRDGKEFKSFEDFATHILWQGLESSIDDLLLYCRKHDDVQRLIKAEVGKAPDHVGRGHRSDIITPNPRGTNPTYTLRRLKRDRPDLANKVVAGELSANAAAIEAGFRKKPAPLQQMKRLWEGLNQSQREEFLQWIGH